MRSPTTSEPRAHRVLRSALAVAVVACAGACLVTDAGIPSSALFLCTSTDQCPSGWTCDIAASTCVSPDAPRLDGEAVLSTTFAGPARPIRVTFAFDRAIVESETQVTLVDERLGASFPGTFTRVEDAPDHTFELLPIGVPDVLAFVDIRATSEANAVGRALAGPVEIDATAPTIFEDAGQRSAAVAPALATSSSPIVITFSANEPLAVDDPARAPSFRVVRDDDQSSESLAGVVTSGAEVRAELAPDVARAEGAYTVYASSFFDRAWNPAVLDDDALARVGAFVVDATPPAVVFVTVEPETVTPLGDAHELSLCLSVDDAHLRDGAPDGPPEGRVFTLTVAGVDVTSTCAPSVAPCTHSCLVDATTDLAGATTPDEGPVLLTLTATDRAGNVATTSTAVSWDERPPEVVNAFAWIEPGPNNVLFAPGALTDGSTLVVAFNTDEPVRGQPEGTPEDDPVVEIACAGDVVIDAQRVPPFASTFFVYRARLMPGVVVDDGPCTVSVSAMDPVGNESERVLDELPPIIIDRAAPDAANIDADGLVHFRAPWGMLVDEPAAGAALVPPFHTITDLDDQSLVSGALFSALGEEIVIVRIFDAPIGDGTEIGRAAREFGDDGTPLDPPVFQMPVFATRDAPAVWVSIVDSAGNDSPRVRVGRGQWVSNTGSSSTWDLADNPMTLLSTPLMTPVLFPATATNARYPDPLLDPSGATSEGNANALAALVDVEGAATFERVRSTDAPTPFPVDGAAVGSDPVRGRVLLFGGARAGVPTDRLWELDGSRAIERCTSLFEPCFWQRPSPRVGAAIVYEPKSARSLVVGGCATKAGEAVGQCVPSADVFLFDGTAFEKLVCDEAVCGPLARHRHAVDIDREGDAALYVFGGCLDAACSTRSRALLHVVDGSITALCDDTGAGCTGTAPDPRADAALVVTDGRAIVFGGCTAYDGTTSFGCTAPQGDVHALDLATRVWTKLPSPTPAFACARASAAHVADGALYGGLDRAHYALCAPTAGAPRLVKIAYPDVSEVPFAPSNDTFEDDPTRALVTDSARERLVAVSRTRATALLREADDALVYPMHLVDETTVAPPHGASRAFFAVPSGDVVMAVVVTGVPRTYAWSGGSWRLVCAGCGPAPVDKATSVENGPLAGGVVLSAGQTWHYTDDGSADPWVNLGFAVPAIDGIALAPMGNGAVLLTGTSGGAHAAARLDENGYTALDTSGVTMPPRFFSGLVYAPERSGVLAFGGCGNILCGPLADTHVLTANAGALTSSEVTSTIVPAARASPILVREPLRGRIVLFGGNSLFLLAVNDGVHELFGETWRPRVVVDPEQDGAPTNMAVDPAAGDVRGGGVLFTDGQLDDGSARIWRYDGGARTAPGHIAITALVAASIPNESVVDRVFTRFYGGGSSPIADGVVLLAWRGDRWFALGGGVGDATSLTQATALLGDDGDPLTDDIPVDPFVFDASRAMAFALVPLPNATGVARLTSTYVDVIVRYQLP